MDMTIFTVPELMYELVTDTAAIHPADLYCLADMHTEDMAELQAYWLLVPARRRTWIARECLALLRGSRTLQFNAFFRHLLTDSEPFVRQQALEGLGFDMEAQSIGPVLQVWAEDAILDVRLEAAHTLGLFLLQGELKSWPGQLQDEMVEALMQVAADPSAALTLQCRALESLGYSSHARIRDLLGEAVASDLEEMRVSALVAMGRSSNRAWSGIILEAFDDHAPPVRLAAVQAAGALRLDSFRDICCTILEYEEEREIRLAAIEALGRIGGADAWQGLLLAAETGDQEELEAVAQAIEDFAEDDLPM